MGIKEKIIATISAIVFCIVLGWQANNVWTGYKNEKVLLQQEAVTATIQASQATIAKQLEDAKAGILTAAAANKNTVTTIIKNNQPIYSRQCLDQDGIDELKRYKEESNK